MCVVGIGSLNANSHLTAESCYVQVLASSGGREGVMPYLEAFKTLIRCALKTVNGMPSCIDTPESLRSP